MKCLTNNSDIPCNHIRHAGYPGNAHDESQWIITSQRGSSAIRNCDEKQEINWPGKDPPKSLHFWIWPARNVHDFHYRRVIYTVRNLAEKM